LSGQSTKTNKVASDATIEAPECSLHVLNGVELPCRLLVADWPSIGDLSGGINDRLSDNYGCSALFVRTAMRYCVNVAVNWVCAWRAVHT